MKMATGYGNSTFDRSALLAHFSDSNKDTTNTDDSFDCLEAGMAAGDFEEVSSSCSEAIDSCVSDGNGESDCDIDDLPYLDSMGSRISVFDMLIHFS